MLRVEATIRSDKHIPFPITGTGTDCASPKAKAHHAGSFRDVAACELNVGGSQSVVGCACFLGAGRLFWWALRRLWLFEPSRLIPKYSQYHRLIVSLLRLCSYRLVV
jgi:hypothetical protein